MLTSQYNALYAATRAYLVAFGPAALVSATKEIAAALAAEGAAAVAAVFADGVRAAAESVADSVTATDKRRGRKK